MHTSRAGPSDERSARVEQAGRYEAIVQTTHRLFL
jgi:hypothetical protein